GFEGESALGKEVRKGESDEQVMAAVAEDRVEDLTRFLDGGGDPNKFFTVAVSDGSIACVKLMLLRGVKVNRLDEHGMTPLMVAAKYAYRGGKDMVEFLLSQGADVNAYSKKGSTALMFASFFEDSDDENLYAEIVQMLIAKGAMVNVKNQLGATPLNIAQQGNSLKIVAILKKAGAKF
nr:ankyrin repeat domain-containing protein [Nostocaceae cyanobacterium]